MTGDGQLRAFIERILRLKEEQDTLAADIREVYAEAKGSGFDKTAMGQLVAHLRKVDKVGVAAVEEGQTVFDTYLSAYQRATGTVVATHTHDAASYAEATGREPVQEMHELPETAIQSGLPNEVRSEEPDASDAGTLGQVTSAPAGSGSDKMPATIPDEGSPAFLKRDRKPLRPNCLNPDNCAGYGSHTCHSCIVAALEVEPA